MGMSAICHRLYVCHLYLAKKNSFGEERIGLVFVMILHMHVYEADEFGKNRLNQ
jgi:hypothetical protein